MLNWMAYAGADPSELGEGALRGELVEKDDLIAELESKLSAAMARLESQGSAFFKKVYFAPLQDETQEQLESVIATKQQAIDALTEELSTLKALEQPKYPKLTNLSTFCSSHPDREDELSPLAHKQGREDVLLLEEKNKSLTETLHTVCEKLREKEQVYLENQL
jgi:hypothetical protein